MGSGGLFFDYDNDGHLDIYLVNSGSLDSAIQPYRHPDHMNILYRNKGDGTFVDATAAAGLQQNVGYGMGCLAADYDNDGDADLYLTNFGPNQLYRNNGDGTFTDVTHRMRALRTAIGALARPSGILTLTDTLTST